jgi:hypothetical protein
LESSDEQLTLYLDKKIEKIGLEDKWGYLGTKIWMDFCACWSGEESNRTFVVAPLSN